MQLLETDFEPSFGDRREVLYEILMDGISLAIKNPQISVRLAALSVLATYLQADGLFIARRKRKPKGAEPKLTLRECLVFSDRKRKNRVLSLSSPGDPGYDELVGLFDFAGDSSGQDCRFCSTWVFESDPEEGPETVAVFFKTSKDQSSRKVRKENVAKLFSELPQLFETEEDTFAKDIPPHLEAVLKQLLDGFDRKKIASNLNLSIHTVGGYTKEIYRHFGVHSQAELICKFRNSTRNQPS
ncbi:MAG: LuxR C-terminal-related transcriptional regulator [Verrucomicrobiales bacterium]|nr:LuxR C-terminal-related transcriptional regulator [Verrucomicrobiales bacterium]